MKNQVNMEKFNYMSSIFLGIVFIITNLYKGNYHLFVTFVIVSFLLYVFNKDKKIQNRIIDTILFGIIISFILYSFSKMNKSVNEGFSSKLDDKESSEEEEKEKKIHKKVKKKEIKEEEDDESNSDDEEPYIDAGSTFLKAYKKLDQKQIDGMTKDTKELISTQKNLMETLKTLGPVVTEGKKVLDTFTNYFDK